MNTGLEKVGTGEGAQSESGAFRAGQWRQHTHQCGSKVVHHQQCLYFDRLPVELQQTMHTRYCQHTVNSIRGIHSLSAMLMASMFHQQSADGICRDNLHSIHAVSTISVSHQHTVGGALLCQQSIWWRPAHDHIICGICGMNRLLMSFLHCY